MKSDCILHWAEKIDLILPGDFVERVTAFRDLLYSWNAMHNLTRVPVDDFYRGHILDSLSILLAVPRPQTGDRVADIGTGAGFPGLPLALALPDVAFTLIDKTKKRLIFLEHVCARLEIRNVTLQHGRLEDIARTPDLSHTFQLVVARALAPLPALIELAEPFCAPSSSLIFLKSLSVFEEYDRSAIEVCGQLGLESLNFVPYQLPGSDEQNYLCAITRRSSPALEK